MIRSARLRVQGTDPDGRFAQRGARRRSCPFEQRPRGKLNSSEALAFSAFLNARTPKHVATTVRGAVSTDTHTLTPAFMKADALVRP